MDGQKEKWFWARQQKMEHVIKKRNGNRQYTLVSISNDNFGKPSKSWNDF